MGDKILSKQAAEAAGVSVVPGGQSALKNIEEAKKEAALIGYPVLLKAAAGGGGKGMRVVASEEKLQEGMERAQSEAQSSFADNRIFVEKYIEEPHHIEIQILADTHGNVIHLGERDCSIQRRHQKVIEETPSPFISEEVRQKMSAQAVALSKKVGYVSAGTVEFIVDKHQNFYFLEMNTRLQVEHPVTEIVARVDLVEQMIRIAAGEKISVSFEPQGHAVEARLYAEDPERGFLPSLGRLLKYKEPVGLSNTRIDSGVEEGDLISPFYDPMLGKLIGFGATRNEAIAHLTKLLDHLAISGLNTNQGFLSQLINHPLFKAGTFTTHFIEEHFGEDSKFQADMPDEVIVAVALIGQQISSENLSKSIVVKHNKLTHTLLPIQGGFLLDGTEFPVLTKWKVGDSLLQGTIGGKKLVLQVHLDNGTVIVSWPSRGIVHEQFRIFSERSAELLAKMPERVAKDQGRFLCSSMPGLIMEVCVAENQQVMQGEPLAIIEAMKMENVLCAESNKRVHKILVCPGDNVDVDQPLIEFAA